MYGGIQKGQVQISRQTKGTVCVFLILENVTIVCLQIVVSKKWGFTKFDRVDYNEMREDGRLIPCGVHAKYINNHGPLSAWERLQERNY